MRPECGSRQGMADRRGEQEKARGARKVKQHRVHHVKDKNKHPNAIIAWDLSCYGGISWHARDHDVPDEICDASRLR